MPVIKPLKVLLVDDESIVYDDLRSLIDWEKHGFTLTGWASNRNQAIRLAQKYMPDIVIMDISLPQINGLALTELLRDILPNLAVIVLSGYMDFNYAKRAIDLSVITYLVKHELTGERLIDTLEKARAFIRIQQDSQNLMRRQTLTSLLLGTAGDPDRTTAAESNLTLIQIMPFLSPLANKEAVQYALAHAAAVVNLHPLSEAVHTDPLIVEDTLIVAVQAQTPHNSLNAHQAFARNSASALLNRLHTKNDPSYCAAIPDRPVPVQRIHKIQRLMQQRRFDYLFSTPRAVMLLNSDAAPQEAKPLLDDAVFARMETDIPSALKSIRNALNAAIASHDAQQFIRLVQQIRFHLPTTADPQTTHSLPPQADAIVSHILVELETLARKQQTQAGYSATTIYMIRYLETHYNRQPSLKSIAKALHCNSVYIGQLFRKDTGKYFQDYLNDIRLEKAYQLLSSTNLRISDIANQIGISSTQYFSSIFRQNTNMTPKEYRARHLYR